MGYSSIIFGLNNSTFPFFLIAVGVLVFIAGVAGGDAKFLGLQFAKFDDKAKKGMLWLGPSLFVLGLIWLVASTFLPDLISYSKGHASQPAVSAQNTVPHQIPTRPQDNPANNGVGSGHHSIHRATPVKPVPQAPPQSASQIGAVSASTQVPNPQRVETTPATEPAPSPITPAEKCAKVVHITGWSLVIDDGKGQDHRLPHLEYQISIDRSQSQTLIAAIDREFNDKELLSGLHDDKRIRLKYNDNDAQSLWSEIRSLVRATLSNPEQTEDDPFGPDPAKYPQWSITHDIGASSIGWRYQIMKNGNRDRTVTTKEPQIAISKLSTRSAQMIADLDAAAIRRLDLQCSDAQWDERFPK